MRPTQGLVLDVTKLQMPINWPLFNNVMHARPRRLSCQETNTIVQCDQNIYPPLITPKPYGQFAVPFDVSVSPIFTLMTGLPLFYYAPFQCFGRSLNELEYSQVKAWLNDIGSTIFIRDLLALSVALNFHQYADEQRNFHRTDIGELMRQAKYQRKANAINKLVELLREKINQLPLYQSADLILPVPTSPGKPVSLPENLSKKLCAIMQKPDLSPYLSWNRHKKDVKQRTNTKLTAEQKWTELEQTGLTFNGSGIDLTGKNIILIDDIYQTGATMHVVAKCLLQHGAQNIYGLSVTKALRNS